MTHEVFIEKVAHASGDNPSLVGEIDRLFEEISVGWRASASESWLEDLRDRFWQRQLELTDEPDNFRIRMACPDFDKGRLRVIVTNTGIDVLGDRNVVIRRVPIAGRLDPHAVSATLHDGYLQIQGAKIVEAYKRMAKSAGRAG